MKNSTNQSSHSRRQFLKASSALAASAIVLPMSFSKTFGAAKPSAKIPAVTLNNGVEMPMLGFGTNTLKGDIGVESVADAIKLGYRLIDTATVYGNEQFVGEGIRKSGIDREELFLTSKLWVSDSGYESTKKAFATSLDKLGTDYLDLYLVHRPRGDVKGTWQAMEELYKAGKIKAIGVSNFLANHLDELKEYGTVVPAVNQIETHVFFQQEEAHEDLARRNIQHEAWSPFAAARNNVFTNETIAGIGRKYSKSNAQVCLRWLFQRGIVAIPRSSDHEHRKENLEIFDFKLTQTDMNDISELDLDRTQFPEWG